MRFMIIVKANADSEAGVMPEEALMAAMADYHEQLAQAGVLLDATGLHPSSKGWRIRYSGGQRQLVEGPFAETQALIGGYTLIQVRSREEAVEWTRRFPAPMGERQDAEIEVRQVFELDDFAQGAAVERFRKLEAGTGAQA
ncbi:YciI family protein [Sphaerotilaceae bacterium SBD11-9]